MTKATSKATTNKKAGSRKALGKGLGALIPSDDDSRPANGLFSAPVSKIRRAPAQPRRVFDPTALEELAASIQQSGLLQPLVVRELDGEFELIAGERRWRACQIAGMTEIPVVVREMTDAEAFATALVENIQREDLNPLEEAHAYQKLLDDFGYTQATVATAVGKSRSAVANAVRLLNLPTSVQQYVEDGGLSAGHARALAALPMNEAADLAEVMVAHDMSVREAEQLVRDSKEPPKAPEKKPNASASFRDDAQVRRVTDELMQALGTRVIVKDKHGKGRIEIHYSDYDVLQDVLDRLL